MNIMQVNANAMTSMSQWMNTSANNVANVNTEGYNASRTTMNAQNNTVVAQTSQTQSQTDLAKEFTDQITIDKSFEANAQTIKAKDEMIGSLLDLSI